MPNTTQKVEFLQFHQPPLDSGVYEISVEQKFNPGSGDQTYEKNLKFAVIGHRYDPLNAYDVYGVFPAAKSLGDHSNVIPHITLQRSTLPWERSCDDSDLDLPWLVLLVFWGEEKPELQTVTLEQLKENLYFQNWSGEPGEQDEDEISVIDVPKSLVEKIMPKRADLKYLGHVRQGKDEDDNPTETEMATVIANRLPKPGGITTVHLVSVENRFNKGGDFDYQGATGDPLIRFVSLKNWSFACTAPDQSFTQLLLNLDRDPNSLRLPALEPTNEPAEKYLEMGYVPLNHGLRNGEKTVSWYHGPLSPGQNPGELVESVQAGDALLRYDSSNSLFDTSYAAAWELGRLLTLNNQSVAVALYNFKRAYSHALQNIEDALLHLPFLADFTPLPKPINNPIINWFKDLEFLKGIPFNYLVPDERLLPQESIRFFWVDSYWVDCMQDGAFSIGRVIPTDVAKETRMRQEYRRDLRSYADETITGILLRSEVVSGWPGLLVDGYGTKLNGSTSFVPGVDPLKLLRMERLSKNVLICLFAGEVKTVDIHLKPETMHFGVDPYSASNTQFTKGLRDSDGTQNKYQIDAVPCHDFDLGVINIEQFAMAIKDALPNRHADSEFTSAQFGLEMIEGVQKVRFTQSS
ncbi:hypothetical protein [Moorena sp. SIO4G3]|uniref:hypothetical protein n=1 Tax=Moorena sp. SIO4G3 TaxID=2607821 RepID=UPI00142ADD18|nr:hypothetical protein [Moorena sp. SIO4G3]NEO79494.1 hypothetical protein [Moorena sp. SIO4G3]